ncbi:MAG TPA: L-histidine N(alpha)-methyltransferase [Blastocatellia bacterium]|nr:L-histidine N(alpha)-methyltransferase [Blastocatellia bacterium]
MIIHQPPSRNNPNQFADDVRLGLTAAPKTLSPKYFYDALGSQLFEAICLLPEYYLTRAEAQIFEHHAAEIVAQLPNPVSIVELGSGSSIKTRLLIEALLARQRRLHYQPIDISATILEQSADKLLGAYPNLQITAQVGDYTQGLGSIARQSDERVLVLFLGSNIGNYPPEEATDLLRRFRAALIPGDGLLLGTDLKKPAHILEPAYNDALGVTATFNLNLLLRINRELGANFDLRRFEHNARYHEQLGRVEIRIISRPAQTVRIEKLGIQVEFQEGEAIYTESSYKYDLAQLRTIAESTGFKPVRFWLDPERLFGCNFWKAI